MDEKLRAKQFYFFCSLQKVDTVGISFLKWYKIFFNVNHILFIGFLPENIWLRNWLKNPVPGALVRRW